MQLIQQHTVSFNCETVDFGKKIQSELGLLLEKSFYPKLEVLLNKYDSDGFVWNINKLEIEIPEIEKRNWKEDFVEKSLEKIEIFLKSNQPKIHDGKPSESDEINLLNQERYAEKLLLYFLETGNFPSNSFSKDLDEIVSKISLNEIFISQILDLFKENHESILRFIFSVAEDSKQEFLKFLGFEKLFTENFSLNKIFIENHASEDFKNKFNFEKSLQNWSELLSWASYLKIQKNLPKSLYNFLAEVSQKYWDISENELHDFLNLKISEDNLEAEFYKSWKENLDEKELETAKAKHITEDFLYIENAGLVLLHPFFPMLFGQLFFTENQVWKSQAKLQKAILMLHFLVYGNVDFQENLLALNKILCGIETDEVIDTTIALNDEEKEACNDLLDAVLQHWDVMKTSSREALRENFLKRNGKLEKNGNELILWVEEKGFDLLLEKIPWGIATIKTPWMENYLTCNWNY